MIQISGVESIEQALTKKLEQLLAAAGEAIPSEAHQLLAKAQQAVPRLTGELADSASVETQTINGSTVATVVYTDPKAAAVHEGFHWGHKDSGAKGYKWLERSLNESEAGFAERMAKALGGAL
jgi:hypothetical protein